MGKYVVKIGDQIYSDDIEGSEGWTQVIEREIDDKILRTKGNYDFKAWCKLYTFFYNHLITQGVCSPLVADVNWQKDCQTDFTKIWRGQILPQDWQFDLDKDVLEGQILENIWASQFENVQDQEIFLNSNRTINGALMPPLTKIPVQMFLMQDPVGTYLPFTRDFFKVFDVLAFLVNYYTDGTVTFESDFFSEGGEGYNYGITSGQEILTNNGRQNPQLSWKDAFEQLDKLFNLWIIVEADLENPVIRVENDAYVYRDEVVLEIRDPEKIAMDIDLKQLYTSVSVGSENQTDYDNIIGALYLNGFYLAWGDETYNSGGCGFENNELDLQQDWFIDTNSINSQFPINNPEDEQNFDEIFLVEISWETNRCIEFTNNSTVCTSPTVPCKFYNQNLTNNNVLERWRDQLPSFIFRSLTTNYIVEACCPNEDALFNPAFGYALPVNNNLPNGNPFNWSCVIRDQDNIYSQQLDPPSLIGRFVSPVSSYYNVNAEVNLAVGALNNLGLITFAFSIYSDDTYADKFAQYNGTTFQWIPSGTWVASIDLTNIYMAGGAIGRFEIYVEFDGGGNPFVFFNGGCCNFFGGQIPLEQGTETPRIYKYDIARFGLSVDDFNILNQNPWSKIRFIDTKRSRQWELWISSLEFSHEQCTVLSGEFYGAPPIALPSCWVLEYEENLFGRWNDECFWIDSRRWIDNP